MFNTEKDSKKGLFTTIIDGFKWTLSNFAEKAIDILGKTGKAIANIAISTIGGGIKGIGNGAKMFFKGLAADTKNAWDSMKAPKDAGLLRKIGQNIFAGAASLIVGTGVGVVDGVMQIAKETTKGFTSGIKEEFRKNAVKEIKEIKENPALEKKFVNQNTDLKISKKVTEMKTQLDAKNILNNNIPLSPPDLRKKEPINNQQSHR